MCLFVCLFVRLLACLFGGAFAHFSFASASGAQLHLHHEHNCNSIPRAIATASCGQACLHPSCFRIPCAVASASHTQFDAVQGSISSRAQLHRHAGDMRETCRRHAGNMRATCAQLHVHHGCDLNPMPLTRGMGVQVHSQAGGVDMAYGRGSLAKQPNKQPTTQTRKHTNTHQPTNQPTNQRTSRQTNKRTTHQQTITQRNA